MTPEAIKQLQTSLGLTPTGVMDTATHAAMTNAVTTSVSSNPGMQRYLSTNSVENIVNGFFSNNLSSIVDITGQPFTKKQQQAAVAEAERVFNPGFKAQAAFDQSVVEDTLRGQQEDFGQFQQAEEQMFGDQKDVLDNNAADQGVLFSGSRLQKQNDFGTPFKIEKLFSADGLRIIFEQPLETISLLGETKMRKVCLIFMTYPAKVNSMLEWLVVKLVNQVCLPLTTQVSSTSKVPGMWLILQPCSNERRTL